MLLLVVAPRGFCAEVFTSGALPDLTDAASFQISDDEVSEGPSLYFNHFLHSDTPATPVTVRSIEFYGFTIYVPFLGADGVVPYELVLGSDPISVIALDRTDVSPAVLSPSSGVATTPVQRIRIDIEPITVEAEDQMLIRGLGGAVEEWYMALADPAISGINLESYSDANLTSPVAVTEGEAFYFALHDTFLVSEPALTGDLNGDGFVGQDDLNIVLGAWGTNVTPGDLLAGDPSGDGFVGQDDLNDVLAGWGQGTPPSFAVVPEPGSATIFVLGVAIARRRR